MENFVYICCKNRAELTESAFSAGPIFANKLTSLETLEKNSREGIFASIEEWRSDLPSLKVGNNHCEFQGGPLEKFSGELPNLANGDGMFYGANHLNNWDIDLPNLVNGRQMFAYCSRMENFKSVLPNLLGGKEMFVNTILTVESVKNIAQALGDINGKHWEDWSYTTGGAQHNTLLEEYGIQSNDFGLITIHVNSSTVTASDPVFKQAIADIKAKGWTVSTNIFMS